MSKSVYAVVKNNLMVTKLFFVSEGVNLAGSKTLNISRKIGADTIRVELEFLKDGKIWINPPSYAFSSRTSHCEFAMPESRWTRRKGVIFGLVKALKRAEVWPFISNKNFFRVNENCAGFGKKKGLQSVVSQEVEDIMSYGTLKKSKEARKQLQKQADKFLKLAVMGE